MVVQTCGRSWRSNCDVGLQRLAGSHLVDGRHAEQVVAQGCVTKAVYRHAASVAVHDRRTLPYHRVHVLVFHYVRRHPRSSVVVRSVPVQQNGVARFLGSQTTRRSRRLACKSVNTRATCVDVTMWFSGRDMFSVIEYTTCIVMKMNIIYSPTKETTNGLISRG